MRIRSIKFWATVLILLICVVTMSLYGFLSFNNLSKSMEKQYKNESKYVLRENSIAFKNQFSNVEDLIDQLAQSPILKIDQPNDDNINSLLKTYQKMPSTNGKIYFALENGGLYQGTSDHVPEGYNPVKQEWYNLAKSSSGEIVWTEPYLNYINQEIMITASKLVQGPNGMEGVIAIDFNLLDISSKFSNASIGKDGIVMLLSSKGTIIANRDNSMIGESLFGSEFTEMIKKTNKRHVPFTIQDKNYLLHSELIPQNGMSIMTAISKEEINQNLIKSHTPIFIAGVLCLLIFSFIAYLATLRGVRPLEKLGVLMNYVEKGNYEVLANVRDYKEILRLADGFNSMTTAIKKRDEELLISNNELKIADQKLRSKYEELKESQRILKESEEKILDLALHDSLTGLLNRRSLLENLNNSIKHHHDGSLKAIVFIDLDNFKNINDSLGHSFGDKVLNEVAKKLNSLTVINKDVARISGDEFILVIHDLESIKQAEFIAKEINSKFDIPFKLQSKVLNVTASIGVAVYPLHANTTEDLLKIADMAMYRAKDNGKNGYRIFDEGIKQTVDEKLRIELGIHECIDKNEFELFFQPLFNTVEGRITSLEALLRTRNPILSKYNTLQIIQIAEETGQIVEIDKWVLREACMTIQKINKQVKHHVNISVNISAIHIMQQNFVDNIRAIVKETGVCPEWIELEITETSLMESFDSNKRKLDEIKELGISIHLDDFGTGYSSLSYLKSLPIERVKIDKSFVDTMLQSEKDSRIIEAIITLAHNIGLHVVAEGVEQVEQFEVLQKYNCELLQGYFISKPVNYHNLISILQKRP